MISELQSRLKLNPAIIFPKWGSDRPPPPGPPMAPSVDSMMGSPSRPPPPHPLLPSATPPLTSPSRDGCEGGVWWSKGRKGHGGAWVYQKGGSCFFWIPIFGIPIFGISFFGIPIFGISIFGIPIFGCSSSPHRAEGG